MSKCSYWNSGKKKTGEVSVYDGKGILFILYAEIRCLKSNKHCNTNIASWNGDFLQSWWKNLYSNIFDLQRCFGRFDCNCAMAKILFFFCFISQLNTAKPLKTITTSFLHLPPAPQPSCRLTGELQSEALLAGEEVCGELHADSVEGAVGVLGHRWATQLS